MKTPQSRTPRELRTLGRDKDINITLQTTATCCNNKHPSLSRVISSMLNALRTSQRAPRIVAPYTRLLTHSSQRRSYASVTDLSSLPKPGAQLHGFTLRRTKHVPELELSALHFTHDKSGADYLHVARDDNNNVFSIGFKTNPPDATGVPHILEHVTLCGSEK